MTVTALVSGGKDSVYAASLADAQARTVDELLVLRPANPDSPLFHTPNLDLVRLQAEAWGKRYREHWAEGTDERSEEEALHRALAGETGWVVAGAIASSYQWSRLHRVAFALGRPVCTPLWGKDPGRVVRAEIAAGLDIRFTHLAAEPLTPELIDRRLDLPTLEELERRARERRAVNVAGEGGEFETLVVDAPFFRRRIEIEAESVVSTGSTTRRTIRSAHLVAKPGVG